MGGVTGSRVKLLVSSVFVASLEEPLLLFLSLFLLARVQSAGNSECETSEEEGEGEGPATVG